MGASKLFTFSLIIISILFFLQVAGIQTFTGGLVDGLINNPENFKSSLFYVSIVAAIAAFAAVTAIRVGFFGFALSETAIVAVFATAVLVALVGDIISVITYANSICDPNFDCIFSKVIGFIMSLVLIGYSLVLIEWVRGTD